METIFISLSTLLLMIYMIPVLFCLIVFTFLLFGLTNLFK